MADRSFTILSTGSTIINEFLDSQNRDHHTSSIVEVVPFIKIVLNSDEHTRNQILSYAGKSQFVVFTSANAVKAVTAVLHTVPDWKIYCVGIETKKRVTSFFGEPAILDYAGNAEDLSKKIIQHKEKQIVFFCGDQRRDVLPHKLKDYGIQLQEVNVYRTLLSPVRLTKNFDAILFFSPTAVTSFFSVNTLSSQTILFALGETTAAALRSASKNEVILSPRPDKESLLQMAIAYGRSHPIS
jgi:uroporphyrinogen-III synthase